jgi:DNA-binding MarR family transcriptional regulator
MDDKTGAAMYLREEAFHLLRQLFQQHTSRWQSELPELTKPQYAVMRAIQEQPGIEQVALTDAAVSTKATLAEMLSRMESRGLVRRENDPADKRRRFIYLTPEGESLLNAIIPVGNAVDERFLGKLEADERALFTQLIGKMMDKQ